MAKIIDGNNVFLKRRIENELKENPDSFTVEPCDMEGVFFDVNGKSLEITADQAEAFGTALIMAAYQSRKLARMDGI